MKLKTLEEENEKLRSQNSSLKNKQSSLPSDIDQSMIESIMKDRDFLAEKLKQIELARAQGSNVRPEQNIYENKAQMLDNVLSERDELRRQLQKLTEVEKENVELRKKLEKGYEGQKPKFREKSETPNLELRKTQSKCTNLEKEIENLRKERDAMLRRIEVMKFELETLRPKSKEAEMLKLERDKLQIKINELSHVQIHNENLMLKCKCLENALAERDAYKQKYEDILSMECQCDIVRSQTEENKCLMRERDCLRKQLIDLQSCIHDQEEEIKRLLLHIDELVQNKDQVQIRMKDALANMRTEVEKKDSIIALSEERLAAVQMELKSSIQGVSCETICYKTRIEELQRELLQSQKMIRTLQKQLKDKIMTKDQIDLFENMKKELSEAREENKKLQEIAKKMAVLTGDEHVQKMLKQSECAVRKVVEELSKQYKEWDLMRKKQSPVSKEHLYATSNDLTASDEMEMKKELDEIKKEKEKLEKIVAEIQKEKYARSCQKMMDYLQSENHRLRGQLQKEISLRRKLEQKTNSLT